MQAWLNRNSPMDILQVAGGKPVKLWTDGVPVEDDARRQLLNTAKMPFIFKHLARARPLAA